MEIKKTLLIQCFSSLMNIIFIFDFSIYNNIFAHLNSKNFVNQYFRLVSGCQIQKIKCTK